MRGESMKGKSKKSTYSTTFGVDPIVTPIVATTHGADSIPMDWQILLEHLDISYTRSFILEERFSTQINLYNCISFTNMHYPVPFLFICDSLSQIRGNRNWIRNRSNPDDIVIDLNGNLINLQSLI